MMCLALGEGTHPETARSGDNRDVLFIADRLSPLQLRAALWVVGSVMEDAARLDLNSEKKLVVDVRRTTAQEAKYD